MNESFDHTLKPIDAPIIDFIGFESDEYQVIADHLTVAGQFLPIFAIVRKHDEFASGVYYHCDQNPKFGQLQRAWQNDHGQFNELCSTYDFYDFFAA